MSNTHSKSKLTQVWGILQAIVVIASLIGAFYGLNSYIDTKIEKIVDDERFLNNIASRVSPYIIFDSNGSILLDGGGLQYIEKINILPEDDNIKQPKIIVTPKKYMNHAPLLTCMKLVHYALSIKRGKNTDWEYTLGYVIKPQVFPSEHFRLEIISK